MSIELFSVCNNESFTPSKRVGRIATTLVIAIALNFSFICSIKAFSAVAKEAGSDEIHLSLTLEKSFGQIVRWANSRYCSLAISPDGTLLAAGECHPFSSIHIWSLNSTEPTIVLERHGNACDPECRVSSPTSITFSNDGSKLAAAMFNNNVTVWDMSSGKISLTLQGYGQSEVAHAIDVVFSPDDKIIATGWQPEERVILWDATTGREIGQRADSHLAGGQPFSADGRILAILTSDRSSVLFWSVETGAEETGGCLGPKVTTAAFSKNGKLIAVSGQTHVEFWQLAQEDGNRELSKREAFPQNVCPARKVHGFKIVPPQKDRDGHPQPIIFSPDCSLLLAFRDDRVVAWQTDTLHEALNDRLGYVSSVAFGADGMSFATVGGYGDENGIRLWRLKEREE